MEQPLDQTWDDENDQGLEGNDLEEYESLDRDPEIETDPDHPSVEIADEVEPYNTVDLTSNPSRHPLGNLPLGLTLRCGVITQTLTQLQQLGPGSVVQVQGMTPGHAALYQGEQAIAHGELVEVDGQLGLQITYMMVPS